jgi:hypothetical protein
MTVPDGTQPTVTLQELRLETFFPADDRSANALGGIEQSRGVAGGQEGHLFRTPPRPTAD